MRIRLLYEWLLSKDLLKDIELTGERHDFKIRKNKYIWIIDLRFGAP